MNKLKSDESQSKKIIRLATALYNACIKSNKERKCRECVFGLSYGCELYGHPIEWDDKLEYAKTKIRGGQ